MFVAYMHTSLGTGCCPYNISHNVSYGIVEFLETMRVNESVWIVPGTYPEE